MLKKLRARFWKRYAIYLDLRLLIRARRREVQQTCRSSVQRDAVICALRALELRPSSGNLTLAVMLLEQLKEIEASKSLTTPLNTAIHYVKKHGVEAVCTS